VGPRLPFPPVDAAFPHLTAFEWENSFCVIAVFQTPRTLHDTLPTCSTRRPIRGTRRPSQCRDLSLIDAPRWDGTLFAFGTGRSDSVAAWYDCGDLDASLPQSGVAALVALTPGATQWIEVCLPYPARNLGTCIEAVRIG